MTPKTETPFGVKTSYRGRMISRMGLVSLIALTMIAASASLLLLLCSGVALAATWGPTSITDTANDGYETEGTGVWYADDQPYYNFNYLGYDSANGYGQLNVGLRFTNVTIPQGATINSATIEVYHGSFDRSADPTGQWQAWNTDNAGQFGGSNRPSTVPLTTSYVTHNPTAGAGWKSASVSSVIQEIINRPGWASGNAINLVWMSTISSNAWAPFHDVKTGSYPARLTIDYTVAAWYNSNWQYRKKLTIDYTKVGATLSNFPVLVSLTSDSDLAARARSDGYDILFTSSDGTTKLDHEIERYTSATGALVAWVRIPSLSNSVDTDIFMYYGNAGASNQQNVSGVWSEGGSNYYKGVWHLNETPNDGVAGHVDSTGNGRTGTPYGFSDGGGGTTNSTGIAAGADSFAYSDNNRVEVAHHSSLTPNGDMTVELWVRLDNPSSADHGIYKQQGAWFSYQMYFAGSVPYFIWSNDAQTQTMTYGTTTFQANTWYHIACVKSGTNLQIFVNGTNERTVGGASGNIYPSTDPFHIGATYSGGGGLGGRVDEVRFSGVARTASWLSTQYNNISNPGPASGAFFKSLGSQETNSTVSLANHAAGQEADKFTSTSSVTGAELFAFQLTNNTASTVTVTQVQFQLSSVSGIAQGDLTNLALYVDANGDGTIGGGETTTVGGAGAVNSGVTTLTFSSSFTIGASSTVNYILKGDVSNLVAGDSVTISLGTSNVTLQSGTMGGSAPSNVTHTADSSVCSDTVLKAVQSGTTTIANGNSSATATLTAVDTSKAFLVFGVSENTSNPQDGQISGQITNSTTVTFQRVGTSGAVTVKWYVAEFTSGVSVQRGTSPALTGTSADITISSVDLTKSFPLVSFRITGTTFGGNDFVKAKLTSATNLNLAMQANGDATAFVEWQVVQYACASVQSGDVTFANTETSKTATVTSVDTAKSWLLSTHNHPDGTATDIAQKLVRGQVTNATTLTFDRDSTSGSGQSLNLTWYLVTFTDGTTVQKGTQAFTTAETQKDVTITSVDTGRSLAAGGYMGRGGKSNYTLDDNPGVGWFTLDLTSGTNLRITRGLTGSATADVGWFVVQFPTVTVSLAEHAAGQEADKFTSASSVTGAELFAFRLTNNTASTVTVTQVQFQLSSVTGISQGDFANLALYVDANGDGTIGGGETTTVGGSGAVNSGVSTITFSSSFTINASTTVNYILKGDVSNLAAGDTVTISLGTSNVTLQSGTMGGSAPTSVTHTAKNVNLTQIHYRWRNDDGSEGGLNTGTGADGAISLSSAFNMNTQLRAGGRSYPDGVAYRVGAISGTNITLRNAAGSTLTNTNGIAAGDEILIINLQGSSSDNGSVGNYEFLRVQSVSGGVVTVTSAPTKDYDGSGNSFSTQKVFVQRVPQYTNVTTNAYTITAGAWDGGADHSDSGCTANMYTGIVAFRATGTVTVSVSGSISVNGLGYRAGSGVTGSNVDGNQAESYTGTGSQLPSNNAGGGGGGDISESPPDGDHCGEGGGGGGYGTAGTVGGYGSSCQGIKPQANAGATYGTATLTTLFLGSGGGSGGNDSDSSGASGAGARGAGIVFVVANTITVSGTIQANGSAGSAMSEGDNGAGGGGSGGSVYLGANTVTLGTNLVTATGGAGGSNSGNPLWVGAGGAGGVGRIRVEADSKSGTTNPEASSPASWWNSSWAKRKAITIDNTGNASTLTNYQVKVTVTYDADMQSDFDDIRFTNASGTLLDHWLETKTDGSTATFWVEVESIPASNTATIYMYYGNGSVTSTSSLDNTFRNNSIYLEARRCTDGTNCNFTDNHNEFDSVIAGNYSLDGSGYRTAVNDGTNPYSANQDYFFLRYRFLFRADTTGTHNFGTNSDDASELHRRDVGDTDSSHTVLASWYGGHGTGTCGASGTTGSMSLTAGQVIWLEYRMTEWTGGQLAQACVQEPSGSYQTVDTTNFANQLFSRTITTGTEPTVSTGTEEDKPTAGATWAAYQDTKLTEAIPGKVYRLRFMVSNEGTSGSGAVTYKRQVAQTDNCGTESYTDVPTDNTGPFKIIDSSYLTDGGATTDVVSGITNEATTFVPGQVKDASNTTGSITLNADQFTELEFAITAVDHSDYYVPGANYCFRLVSASGASISTYSVYGEIGTSDCEFKYSRPITIDRTKVAETVTFDAASSNNTLDVTNTVLSWSHTVGSGSNRILLVGVSLRNGGSQTVSGITYGGTALTLLGSAANGTNIRGELWYLKNPAAGAATVQVTISGAATYFAAGAASFFNVEQGSSFGTAVTGNGNSANPSVSVTSAAGELVVDILAKRNTSEAAVVGAGQTQLWNDWSTHETKSNNAISAASMEPGAATVAMSWTFASRPWAIVAVPLKPAGVINYPMLVSLTDTALKNTAYTGGHVESSSGYDIIFRDSNGDLLDFEIERYDPLTGELVAWVRIPYINGKNATSNTVIYMYYGNKCILSSWENITGVWDANFKGVWHLKESGNGTAGEYKDSTSNANNAQGGAGTSSRAPTQTASGKIGLAQDFNRSETDFIRIPDHTSLQITGAITMEAWVRSDAWNASDWSIFMSRQYGTGYSDSYDFGANVSGGSSSASTACGTSGCVDGSSLSTGTWYHMVATFSSSASYMYVNGVQVASTGGITIDIDPNPVLIGGEENDAGSTPIHLWDGIIDEVRISNNVRTAGWILTEYNNQNSPSTFYSVGNEVAAAPTAVSLASLKATGDGDDVVVSWTTAQEINNFGFHVYRSESAGGPYTRITSAMIPGLTFSVRGREYTYMDRYATRGRLYYYKLEDIDYDGTRRMHGPVCVDWDGDGIPDDWEQRYGLNPAVDDSGLDPDGDGLTNLQEYYRNTNPLQVDTDGDGVRDSQEYFGTVSEGLMRGVEVIASDATGMTLELRTESFESVVLEEGGLSYRRLRVPEYVHGYTEVVGKPELPVKGILLDLPAGKGGTLSIESVESKELSNYLIYPVPEKVVSGEGELATVTEVFAIDDAAYRLNRFYPDVVARVGETYDYRGQKKLQVFFNPFSFNPVTGELVQYTKIRVRVAYVALGEEVPVVRSGVPAPAPVSALARAVAWVPPEPASAYKMAVSEEGIYRLTSAWLTSQGVSVSDWSQVRVYNLGQEIPVYQGADYIEFYGTPPSEAYSKYTKHNVYWLTTSGGSGTPLRMETIDGTPGTAGIPSTHVYTVHEEKDQEYLGEAPGPESLDRWVFGSFVYGSGVAGAGPVHFPITLPGVGGTQLGQVSVLLCGLTTLAHDVEIAFNGVSLGTYQWSGFEFYEVSFGDVPLLEGVNTLTLTCLSGSDPMEPDGVALDWVEVAYPRKYEASGNALKITHNAGYKYQVGSFTNGTIEVYDITTPMDVKSVTNLQVTGTNPYTLTMEPRSGSGERTYLILSTTATKTPVSVTKDKAGNLSVTGNGADYVLITHRDLGWDGGGVPQPWLTNLKTQREAQGLRVKVVDVEDIYDEFSYGIASPQGIKDFLSYTYQNWTSPAPQYVLLVGDSAYDPKDNYGLGTINYVPTYLARTPFMGESLTDEWYVRISGNDAIADMDIGRLPAATTAQAERMVNKILTYENTPILKTWERNTLLVADNQVEGYEVLFELMNEDAAGLLPAGMNAPFREYLNDYVNPNDLTASMKSRLNNNGALIWNYSGHGSVQVWASESIFSNGDVATLSNSGKLPFAVAMTCLNGFFGYPEGWNWPSLAEVLLRDSNNGAVAAFMSTGMTEPEGQRVLDQALFEGIFKRDLRTLGRAISYAKQELVANSVALGEVGKTFLLFGDPAMKLKVPLPTAPTAPAGQVSGQSVTLTWGASTDANGGAVAGYNVYRSTTPNGPYTKINSSLITNTQYMDSTVQAGTYYYVVKSVDRDGDQSAGTLEMTVTIGARSVGGSGSGGGGGGGCFISAIAN